MARGPWPIIASVCLLANIWSITLVNKVRSVTSHVINCTPRNVAMGMGTPVHPPGSWECPQPYPLRCSPAPVYAPLQPCCWSLCVTTAYFASSLRIFCFVKLPLEGDRIAVQDCRSLGGLEAQILRGRPCV